MNEIKKIFAKHGYALFEPESIEDAIISAIKNREIRYTLGIPIVIENSDVSYEELIKRAKHAGIYEEVISILQITSQIIKNKEKKRAIARAIGLKKTKIKNKFDKKEFEQVYAGYTRVPHAVGFASDIAYALSFLFAPKQINIIYKLKNGERLTKTEREYFSRVIKKKLIAIKEIAGLAVELTSRI